MEWKEFESTYEVEFSANCISETDLEWHENELDVRLGSQMREYVLHYGYLSFRFAELYGVNSIQREKSDMIKKTRFLHEQFPITKGLIALEDQGDGELYLVSNEDKVYRFFIGDDVVEDRNLKLFEYIVERFLSIKGV